MKRKIERKYRQNQPEFQWSEINMNIVGLDLITDWRDREVIFSLNFALLPKKAKTLFLVEIFN
jgi:hypothetical protein